MLRQGRLRITKSASNVDLEEFKSLKLDMTQWSYDEDNELLPTVSR